MTSYNSSKEAAQQQKRMIEALQRAGIFREDLTLDEVLNVGKELTDIGISPGEEPNFRLAINDDWFFITNVKISDEKKAKFR